MALDFSLKEELKTAWLRITGDFDASTTPELKKICDKIAADGRVNKVIIDFFGVKKIDSSAFACMLGFMKQHQDKLRVIATNLKNLERNFIEVLRLEKWIKIEE